VVVYEERSVDSIETTNIFIISSLGSLFSIETELRAGQLGFDSQ